MRSFTFSTTKTLINEPGGSRRLPEICRQHGGSSVLVVTDRGIVGAGLVERVLPGFESHGLRAELFDEVEADPSEATVREAAKLARTLEIDMVVGFGGGSSMDVAKLVALLAHPDCTQDLADIYGIGNAKGPRLPLIQVPTTAGTGSEVTPIAIVTTGKTTKAGVVSPAIQADVALLDAELTLGLPPLVTAATGIDAMVHAIEAYTTAHHKNPLSDMLAREALRLLSGNIVTAVEEGTNLEARSNMLLGALLAGQAFANAPVAAVHALAYPLGGHFHIPHGISNSLVLPHVMRFNAPQASSLYAELAPILLEKELQVEELQAASSSDLTDQMIEWIECLMTRVGVPHRLRDWEIPESFIPTLASDAMLQQRLLVNNPRVVTEVDALAIYRAAF